MPGLTHTNRLAAGLPPSYTLPTHLVHQLTPAAAQDAHNTNILKACMSKAAKSVLLSAPYTPEHSQRHIPAPNPFPDTLLLTHPYPVLGPDDCESQSQQTHQRSLWRRGDRAPPGPSQSGKSSTEKSSGKRGAAGTAGCCEVRPTEP